MGAGIRNTYIAFANQIASGVLPSTGIFNARAFVAETTQDTTTNAAWVDTSLTGTITITSVGLCDIWAVASAAVASATAGDAADFQLLIDGTAVSVHPFRNGGTGAFDESTCLVGVKTGLAAGTYTCKVQFKRLSGSGNIYYNIDEGANTKNATLSMFAITQ